MSPKRFALEQYKGGLTPDQAAEGIAAALSNARELLADAEALFERASWPRAASLAVLAIEEQGKVPILRALVVARSEEELRDSWREYRSHTQKNVMAAFPDFVHQGASLESFRALYDRDAQHPSLVEAVKQLGFYTDCLGDIRWSVPSEAIDEDLAHGLLGVARILVRDDDELLSSPAELWLWLKHVGPVWRTSMKAMKEALLACYQEAMDLGILRGTAQPDAMRTFLFPGDSRPCLARCEATGGEALGGESRSESSSAAKIRSVAIDREDRSVYGLAESERVRWASARTPASRGGAMDPGRVAGPAIRVFRGHRVLGALVLAIGLGPSAASAPTVGQLWLARYNGPADRADSAYALGVSPDGTRVYVTGRSPGSGTSVDYATVAYNAAIGAQAPRAKSRCKSSRRPWGSNDLDHLPRSLQSQGGGEERQRTP